MAAAPRKRRASSRSSLRCAAALAVCLASAGPAAAQPRERPEDAGTERPALGMERREPWPLRPDPAPGREGSGRPADAHYLFRVGGLTLRLGPGVGWSADPVERRPPTWRSDLPRCGDGHAIHVSRLDLRFASATDLPEGCLHAGEPPGPGGPACAATPEGLRAGRGCFALGLPDDLSIYERPASAATAGEDDRLRRLTIRRRTPLGNEEFRTPVPSRPELDGGSPTYWLPRIGEGAEALGPLLVGCDGARWPDPIPPARIPSRQTCRVVFDAPRAGVRVRYRFPREVYDEPDWQALDLRVRRWIGARATSSFP